MIRLKRAFVICMAVMLGTICAAEILSFSKKNQDTMDKSMRIAKLEAILIPLLDVIIGFSSLASLLYGGWMQFPGKT